MCQVSSFMCQVQLSCVKFMFHLDSTQTKFLDEKLTECKFQNNNFQIEKLKVFPYIIRNENK